VRNSRIGRQLPRLAQAGGLIVTRIVPITTVFRDASDADKILGFHRVTDRAVAAGFMSAPDAADWLSHLASAPFFASATLFVVVAQRR
jgi:hypothetical protein